MKKEIFNYWGKARNAEDGPLSWHLLACHCLDVTSVAKVWLQQDDILRQRFCLLFDCREREAEAWLLFFIALHDLGKFDLRFQSKRADIARKLDPKFESCRSGEAKNYYHGEYAWHWLVDVVPESWEPWLQAVGGHHGEIPTSAPEYLTERGLSQDQLANDRKARSEFINACESLFLQPAGLDRKNDPPSCNDYIRTFIAGFCSICDWIGSMEEDAAGKPAFDYHGRLPDGLDLKGYFDSRRAVAEHLVELSGICRPALSNGGMGVLYPDFIPHQVQTLVDDIPLAQGLTLIEAPTGSGKTEAALAYASRLLAAGQADSIIFTLPTQATANAMLKRLDEAAKQLFPGIDAANLVLAHGKARFNKDFIDLKNTGKRQTNRHSAKEREASVACVQWLTQSRKRVFLGQIGVCTIDQVLISALPVRHKFVRGFGIGKSVLIIDEVHAYDAYMYGLVENVLLSQQEMGGTAVLLSATLPLNQRQSLVDAWTGRPNDRSPIPLSETDTYPLITHISCPDHHTALELSDEERKKAETKGRKQVAISVSTSKDMLPDGALIGEMIGAAEKGALVCVICNLVQDAQTIASRLREQNHIPVDLFHSRFRFKDRQDKEQEILARYGKDEKTRTSGRILVATQVVEQSLDLDFDWMISQLCPIDSLFQRLGRLHRHEREGLRPDGFDKPRCTVLAPRQENPQDPNYGLHQLIYGDKEAPNTRILWRTEQVLGENSELDFPHCYRPLIENVYQRDDWPDEPETLSLAGDTLHIIDQSRKDTAQWLGNANMHEFRDTDSNVAALTRDGEMSLDVVPVIVKDGERYFLDEYLNTPINELDDFHRDERLNMNMVPVPASWRGYFDVSEPDDEGIIYLPMTEDGDAWICETANARFTYTVKNGLEKEGK